MKLKDNYYFSSMFWSITQKVLSSVVGFIATPLLLGYYGKADFGLLSLATACNGYVHILDLGMNVGAVRYFSIWRAEGKNERINRVARTNLSFYGIISFINILLLLIIALFGESWFSVTHEQFQTLKVCLYILAVFSVFNWLTTVFNQLLTADKQMTFIMQMNTLITVLRGLLIGAVFLFSLSLTKYFFLQTLLYASLIIPLVVKCRQDNLVDRLLPALYWKEFNPVLVFSLSIFALSFFQMSATQTRPLILGMFSEDGASCVTDFTIISVFPALIITIAGTFSGIFLPMTSEMVAKGQKEMMAAFCYNWTKRTSIISCVLSFPFILCAKELLCAYVGETYSNLSLWLIIWCFTILVQMHTTPGNALVLAHGRTKELVISTAIFCVISIVLNAALCKLFAVGSAIIAYFVYVILVIGLYYVYYYKHLLGLSRLKLFACFLKPTVIALFLYILINLMPWDISMFGGINARSAYILLCIVKTLVWLIPFVLLIHLFKIEDIRYIFKK